MVGELCWLAVVGLVCCVQGGGVWFVEFVLPPGRFLSACCLGKGRVRAESQSPCFETASSWELPARGAALCRRAAWKMVVEGVPGRAGPVRLPPVQGRSMALPYEEVGAAGGEA